MIWLTICSIKLLLDTQILIWFQLNDAQLPRRIRLLIEDPANEVVISQLSFIEITIKQVTNRLPTFTVLTEERANTAETDGFVILPVSLNHVIAYRQIPFYADHRDPFDRLILATALAEKMPIISADGHFHLYRDIVEVIW